MTARISAQGRDQQWQIMKDSVVKYFDAHPEHWRDIVVPYMRGERWSGRLLNYAITNYFRRKKVFWIMPDGTLFDAHAETRLALSGVHKRGFDPFRRRLVERPDHGYFLYQDVQVSVGLLTWFRWAIRNQVLTYITEHEHEIRKDMAKEARRRKRDRPASTREGANIIVHGDVHITLKIV